jgi:hypothetical protein
LGFPFVVLGFKIFYLMKELFMKRFLLLACVFFSFVGVGSASAQSVDFEDLVLAPESFWNGSDESGGFSSNGVFFSNDYNAEWDSWDGFAYSNLTDTTAAGYAAQYNAIAGSGQNNSANYAVGYVSAFAAGPPTITFDTERTISGAYFTNTNYAYYSMKNGDDFSKKFTSDDWFLLTVTGLNAQGETTGTVSFKLSDGTNIVDTWTWVDLSALGMVKELTFALTSTDNGDYGMNTPAYFAMDSFDQPDETDEPGKKDSDNDDTCFIQSVLFN